MSKLEAKLLPVALLLTRVTIGLYLMLAGVGKVRGEMGDLPGSLGSFYRGPFTSMQPGWLPDFFAAPYGYVLPWAEVIIGALLILGLFGRTMAALVALMILSFTIALAMQHGLTAKPAGSGGGPFSANYIQVAAAFLLACTGPGTISLDRILRGRRAAKTKT
jgi:uncharacterized membrane protein YphA (DoxX/SURF4 family)